MQDESFDSRDDASLPVPVQVGLAAMRARGPSPEAVERLRAGLGLAGPSGLSSLLNRRLPILLLLPSNPRPHRLFCRCPS